MKEIDYICIHLLFTVFNKTMRKIYLPELISINIKNFTLYPNGLNYEYDFVKGVNLIIGGNGMGKTTFVNIIKYAIIGHYKKQFDYTKTYKDRLIEKRILYPLNYFKNRMDDEFVKTENAKVIIHFNINQKRFKVERDLEEITLSSFSVDGNIIDGTLISQSKYEALNENDKSVFLQFKYEKLIEQYSGLLFDDLIFFVNEILFFGEDHKTILWNDGVTGSNVQNELFNNYFNSPELNRERQEAQRQAKYFDSLSRHRSEDIRAIRKVLDKVSNNDGSSDSTIDMIKFQSDIEDIDYEIEKIQSSRVSNDTRVSLLQNKLNELIINSNELEIQKNKTESELISKAWETLHPQYDIFAKNIEYNHICPICNKPNDNLFHDLLEHPNCCFSCGAEIEEITDDNLKKKYKDISNEYKNIHIQIQNNQKEIKQSDDLNRNLDNEFRVLDLKKRKLQTKLRAVEFSKSKNNENSDLQVFRDEIFRLEKEKDLNQEKSRIELARADLFSREIESQITQNVSKFSSLFSSFAESFLGVTCSLTFDNLNGTSKRRFYPVIDGRIRFYEEELSESQRFFIDHSFRMSILSFFYTTPTFYIVETPDSSLDISYENNAATVFLKFLKQPNSLIITSNLNNSSFVNYIVDNKEDICVSIIGLLDIAKQSVIQNTSEILLNMYRDIKSKISKNNE